MQERWKGQIEQWKEQTEQWKGFLTPLKWQTKGSTT
jgi:hypothetical protein